MGCNCKWTEIILGIIIVVFALWQTDYSKWILTIAGVVLVLHALMCKNCGACKHEEPMTAKVVNSTKKSSSKKKK